MIWRADFLSTIFLAGKSKEPGICLNSGWSEYRTYKSRLIRCFGYSDVCFSNPHCTVGIRKTDIGKPETLKKPDILKVGLNYSKSGHFCPIFEFKTISKPDRLTTDLLLLDTSGFLIPTVFGFPKTNLLNDPVVDQNEQFQVDAFTISEIDEEHASFLCL